MKVKKLSLAVMAIVSVPLYLTACLGSSDSSLQSGVFLDAPVKGLFYETSSGLTGTTGADGSFRYASGDTVTFYIGPDKNGTRLGSAAAAATLTPADVNKNQMVEVLQALQSLDDPADGVIDVTGKTAPATCNLTSQTGCKVDATTAKANFDSALAGKGMLKGVSTGKSVAFAEIAAPTTDADMRLVRSAPSITIDGKTTNLTYTTILRSGEQKGASADLNVFGQLLDNTMKPILMADGSKPVSDSNDFSSLLPVNGKLYAVSHFETWPAALYLTELSQDAATGKLTATQTRALDLSGVNGIWDPCAGSVTPWNTHLGSEEYEPDAKAVGTGNIAAGSDTDLGLTGMAKFFGGGTTLNGDRSKTNPYFWGYVTEVKVTDFSTAAVAKHYSMGRFAHELAYVMPDNKTVYASDDGTNVGLFMYVADKAGDLTGGSLYAAKFAQTSAAGSTELPDGTVSWIKLGSSTDTAVKALIDSGIRFADIFDTAAPTGTSPNQSCPTGFKPVNANGNGLECLSLKNGKETAAAFLETRRYAGYMGATTEFRKEEGITYNPEKKLVYVAYSEINNGMLAKTAANSGNANANNNNGISDDVKVTMNYCGAVWAYGLGTDSSIGSDFVLNKLTGSEGVAGRMTTDKDTTGANPTTIASYGSASPYAESGTGKASCDITSLANPDNISYMKGSGVLIIGEDASPDGHRNDYVWAYDTGARKLTRILTTPYGSETTSVYHYPNVNGWGYIVGVVQHPYGESDQSKATGQDASVKRSYFGYIGAN